MNLARRALILFLSSITINLLCSLGLQHINYSTLYYVQIFILIKKNKYRPIFNFLK